MSNSGKAGCFLGFLLLVLVGVYLVLTHRGGSSGPGGQGNPIGISLPFGNNSGSGGTGGGGGGTGTITVQTSGTYGDAVRQWAQDFQQSHPGINVTVLPNKESRQTMQLVLAAYRSQSWDGIPSVWISSTEPLVASLAKQTGGTSLTGDSLINMADSQSFFEWPQQPMVVLARSGRDLSFLTASDDPLNSMPSGQVRFSFPDPLTSSGGHSAIGYVDWSFKRQHRYRTLSSYFQHLTSLGYSPTTDGSGVVAADFYNSGQDFIFIHNALADREISKHSDLKKIALLRTVYETPVATVLSTPNTSGNQKAAAASAFVQYLRDHATLSTTNSGPAIELPAHLDDQKRLWEQVFNHGARLGNINQ